ncbi:SusC/RagA family TonB-linked outer membrane protein, partial [Sinomicrobium sp. FJxs]|nr:SusC/RagA family TonB-linked outer membrane protein [Sinomicrobium weinanense]
DLSFNFSTNKNEVTNTSGGPISIASVSGALPQVREGEPLGVFYGTYYARNGDGSLLLTSEGLPQEERGDLATGQPQRDADGQPMGDQLKKVIGDPNADYILGIGTSLRYKKLSFSMLWEAVQGFDVFDADKRTRQGVGIGKMAEQELTGELPRGYIAAIYPVEEFRIEDGSFVKLREISFTYDFGKIANGIENFRLSLEGRNLFSIDNFFSYDPETNAGGQSNLLRSVNFGNAPIPRTFSLSVSANF